MKIQFTNSPECGLDYKIRERDHVTKAEIIHWAVDECNRQGRSLEDFGPEDTQWKSNSSRIMLLDEQTNTVESMAQWIHDCGEDGLEGLVEVIPLGTEFGTEWNQGTTGLEPEEFYQPREMTDDETFEAAVQKLRDDGRMFEIVQS